MQPTADFDAGRLARSLLRRSRQGALATLMPGSGDPYCSLVNLASHPDGSPILLISRLAVHTKNILADPRVSLMLDERAEGDPLEGSRIMLAGRAEEAGGEAVALLRRRYLNAHPSAEAFVDFKDFSFFRIAPSGAHLVAGFGRIIDLQPAQFLTDITDAAELLAARLHSAPRPGQQIFAGQSAADVDEHRPDRQPGEDCVKVDAGMHEHQQRPGPGHPFMPA